MRRRAKGGHAIDLDYLIDKLEEVLDHGTRLPFTTRVVLDEDEYLRLIDQMRVSVPQEIRNARAIEAERDAVLAAAQEQAAAMMAAARDQAEGLVQDHAVLAQAEERASQVLATAYSDAERIRAEADEYAMEVLEKISVQLDGFRRTVQNGIRHLQQGQTPRVAQGEIEPEVIGGPPPRGPTSSPP